VLRRCHSPGFLHLSAGAAEWWRWARQGPRAHGRAPGAADAGCPGGVRASTAAGTATMQARSPAAGPGTGSTNAASVATPATPPAMAWCILMNKPTRWSGRPVRNPHLPQRPGPVQRAAAERLAGQQELPLVARRRHRVHADVLGDVERLGIRPHRPPQPGSGPAQDLTEARGQVQPPADGPAQGIDQKSAIRVEQRSAAEGDKRPDVLGPALLLRPDQHEIRSGHAIEPGRPALGVRPVTTSPHRGCHLLCRNDQTTIVTLAPSCRYRAGRGAPPPQYPNTAARSMPSVSRSSA
jgi:hypothetical protein